MRDRLDQALERAEPAIRAASATMHYWIWIVVAVFLITSGFGMGTGGAFRWLAAALVLVAAVIAHLVRTENASRAGEVADRTVSLVRSRADHFARSAVVDDLSGALRRRAFEEAIASEHERLRNAKGADDAALVLVHLPARRSDGDDAHAVTRLRQTVGTLRAFVRFDDAVGRVGDDEFGLLLYAVSVDKAWRIARRVQVALQPEGFPENERGRTVRIGATSLRSAATPAHAIRRAVDTYSNPAA